MDDPKLMNALRLVAVSQVRVDQAMRRLLRESELRERRVLAAYKHGASIKQIVAMGGVPQTTVYVITHQVRRKDNGRAIEVGDT